MSETNGQRAAAKPASGAEKATGVQTHNRNDVMRLLAISGTLFDRLVRDGAPVETSGDGPTTRIAVHLPAFVKFWIADSVKKATGSGDEVGQMSFEQAKRKDKEVQANVREMELLKLQGKMVDIEDVRPFLRETFAIVRSRMLSVASQVSGLDARQQHEIKDAVNDALADLSEDRPNNWTPPDAAAVAQQPVN